MPEYSMVYGVSDKVISNTAIWKYVAYILTFLIGTIFAKLIHHKKLSNYTISSDNALDVSIRYLKSANIFFWVFIISEVSYMLPLFKNLPNVIKVGMQSGFSIVYYTLESESSLISTFINVFPYPLIVYSYLLINSEESLMRNKVKQKFIILSTVIFFHSVFAAKRMYFVYYMVIVILSFLIKNRKKIVNTRIVYGGVITAAVIYIAELLRYGINIANRLNTSVISKEVFASTYQYLMNAYIYSDVNNAMLILSQNSPLKLVSSASNLFRIAATRLLGADVSSYTSLENWDSLYGTVNHFALLWYDLSYLSYLVIFLIGYFSHYYYYKSKNRNFQMNKYTLIYFLIVVGIISNLRINFFAQTVFFIPFIIVLFVGKFKIVK
jgi:hypothetical protein